MLYNIVTILYKGVTDMAKKGVIHIDDNIKKTAETLLNEMGMSATTAVEVFFRQIIRMGKIPFEIEIRHFPNAETVAAIREGDEMLMNKSGKSYNSTKKMFDDILNED